MSSSSNVQYVLYYCKIIGGGFHGKSTLLRALAVGIYDKIPFDGREIVIALQNTVTIRAEDGRAVHNINISSFLSHLPPSSALLPSSFTTPCCSGSTSQAVNIIEALELLSSDKQGLLLLDEDSCANNFMVRDSRMRSLVPHEPITPFSYRVNGLFRQLGISTVIVTGGTVSFLAIIITF